METATELVVVRSRPAASRFRRLQLNLSTSKTSPVSGVQLDILAALEPVNRALSLSMGHLLVLVLDLLDLVVAGSLNLVDKLDEQGHGVLGQRLERVLGDRSPPSINSWNRFETPIHNIC